MHPDHRVRMMPSMTTLATLNRERQKDRIHRCEKHPDKLQYRTVDEAFSTAERRSAAEGFPIHVYACDVCGYFHLSKKAGTEQIGRSVLSRDDARVWTSESANRDGRPSARVFEPEPDVSAETLAADRARFAEIWAQLGHPVTIGARDLTPFLEDASMSAGPQVARRLLRRSGWVMTGERRHALWHHPEHVPDTVAQLDKRTRLYHERQQASRATAPLSTAPKPAPKAAAPNPSAPEPAQAAAAVTPIRRATVPEPVRPVRPGWQTVDVSAVGHLSVTDLFATLRALGMRAEIRVQYPKLAE